MTGRTGATGATGESGRSGSTGATGGTGPVGPSMLGRKSAFENEGLANILDEQSKEQEEMGSSVKQLIYVAGGWLGAVTIATIVIFVVIYKRLGRDPLDDKLIKDGDAEAGSSQSSHCSIVDVAGSIFPPLSREGSKQCVADDTDDTNPRPSTSQAQVHSSHR